MKIEKFEIRRLYGKYGFLWNLNPNAQVIIATHSPGVVMDGWEQMITNVSDIMTVQE